MPARTLRSFAPAILWVVCALVLALGSGGIVSAMEHAPGTSARNELTWTADRRIAPELAAAAGDLRKLSTDVNSLSTLGTNALVGVTGGDEATIKSSIANGQVLLETINAETAALRARLAGMSGFGEGAEARLGGLTLDRYQTLSRALDATHGLADSWDRLTTGGLAAVQIQKALFDHDASTGEAARLGASAKYSEAVTQLQKSSVAIAEARRQSAAMAIAVDTSVLNTWIDRNESYDLVLGRLYSLLTASGGKVTPEIQATYTDEQAARALLPGDTRGLVIIMGDLARGQLNQAVITIEESKARLSAALAAFEATGTGDAAPGSTSPPGGSPSTAP